MYITKSTEKITPCGGFNFCFKSFHQSGLARLIDRQLRDRVKTVGFSYSDIVANHMGIFFAGGTVPKTSMFTSGSLLAR